MTGFDLSNNFNPNQKKIWENCETPRRPTAEKTHLAYQSSIHFSRIIHGPEVSSSVLGPVQ